MNHIASLGLLVLVASMIFSGIPISTAAQSDSNILLKIVSQAKREVEQQISLDASEDVKRLYEEASREAVLLEQSLENGDISSAKQHFLSAMQLFKRITLAVSSDTPTVESVTRATDVPRDIISDLKRAIKYLASLKSIAKRQNAGIDFTEIDRLIETTKNNIRDGNFDEAKDDINQIKRLINEINKTIRKQAKQNESDRAKSYAQKYLASLDRLIEMAKSQGYPQETINKLEEAREKLATASNPHEIIRQVKHIISIKEHFDLTKIDRIDSRVSQIKNKLERLAEVEGIDTSLLEDAQSVFSELRESISDKNYDKALELLRTLSELVNKLENLIS